MGNAMGNAMGNVADVQGTEPLVLLVECNSDIADVTSQLIRGEGYKVHHVADAQQAQHYLHNLISANQSLPALTLLDDLANEDAAVAFLNLLEAKSDGFPRVILFSELPRQRLEEMAQRIRAVGIVVKPFDTDYLIRIIRATIGPASRTDRA